MRGKKAFYNVVIMLIYQLVTTICAFILPRYILIYFGSAQNGIIASITQFLSFVSIFRIGIAGATRVELYKALSNKNENEVSGIIVATEKYMRKIAYIIIVYIIVLAAVSPYILGDSMNKLSLTLLVVAIGIGTFAEYFFGITYQTLLSADQKNYIYYIIQSIMTALNTVCAITLINVGQSLSIVKLGSAVFFLVSPIILRLYVKKNYSINYNVKPDTKALSNRKNVAAQSIANIVHNNTDIIILTLFTSPLIISVYGVYNYVISALNKMMTIFTTGLEAAFGSMYAKKEYDLMEQNLTVFEFVSGSFISIAFSCTAVLLLPFVSLYTKGVTDVEYIRPVFAIIFMFSMAVQCFRQPYLTVVQAAGKYKETRNGAILEAAINLLLSLILVKKLGLIGVAIGTFVANLFRTIQYVLYTSKNIVKRTLLKTLKSLVWIVINFTIAVLICKIIDKSFEHTTWFNWLICAVIYGLISCIVTFITSLFFYKKQLKKVISIIFKH